MEKNNVERQEKLYPTLRDVAHDNIEIMRTNSNDNFIAYLIQANGGNYIKGVNRNKSILAVRTIPNLAEFRLLGLPLMIENDHFKLKTSCSQQPK